MQCIFDVAQFFTPLLTISWKIIILVSACKIPIIEIVIVIFIILCIFGNICRTCLTLDDTSQFCIFKGFVGVVSLFYQLMNYDEKVWNVFDFKIVILSCTRNDNTHIYNLVSTSYTCSSQHSLYIRFVSRCLFVSVLDVLHPRFYIVFCLSISIVCICL